MIVEQPRTGAFELIAFALNAHRRGLVTEEFVIGEFPRVKPAARFEREFPERGRSVRVEQFGGMQSGEQIDQRTPRAEEILFSQPLQRTAQRQPHLMSGGPQRFRNVNIAFQPSDITPAFLPISSNTC